MGYSPHWHSCCSAFRFLSETRPAENDAAVSPISPIMIVSMKRRLDHCRCTNIVSGFLNRFPNLWVKPISHIDNRGSLLENAECLDQGGRKSLCWPTNVEVLQRAVRAVTQIPHINLLNIPLCLRAPVSICWYSELPKGVTLYTIFLILYVSGYYRL